MRMKFAVVIVVLAFAGHGLAGTPWVAEPRPDDWWQERHEGLVALTEATRGDQKITFVGDSITEGWGGNGANVWNQFYAPRHAYNYGIGGDKTENVLYRIENNEFDGLTSTASVLMIGTNNLSGNTIEDIARGVREILDQLQGKMPQTKIVLLGVLPRGGDLGTKAKQLNVLLAEFGNNDNVIWLDMWNQFSDANGNLKPGLYTDDNLHLIEGGYQVWQQTLEPTLQQLGIGGVQ